MKKMYVLFIVIAIIILGCASAVRLAMAEGEGVYEFTEQNPVSKTEAYNSARIWLAQNAGDYQKVVKLEDEKTGTLVLKPSMKVKVAGVWKWMYYTITIKVDEKQIKFNFVVNEMAEGFYPPADQMDYIKNHFIVIKTNIMEQLLNKN